MGEMRLTMHNGRTDSAGRAYTAKHNDRNFPTEHAEHIDADKSHENFYTHWLSREHSDWTFEQAEAAYYERHFWKALDVKNEKAVATRHPGRVRTMDQYRKSPQTCPEERIICIGRKGETIDTKTLLAAMSKQLWWEHEKYPQFFVLNLAIHQDEEGAPHAHVRGVWVAHDNAGREIVGQTKALAEMGIAPPDPSKKYGKYNNAKMTYTRACREHLLEICKEMGLEIIEEPRERSKSGLELEEYKARQEEEKAREAARRAAESRGEAEKADRQVKLREKDLAAAEAKLGAVEAETAANLALKINKMEKKKGLFLKKRSEDDPFITVTRRAYDEVSEAGEKAADRLQAVAQKEKAIAEREAMLTLREREIEPMYEKAAAEKREADRLLGGVREEIKREAVRVYNEFVASSFFVDPGTREKRMEKFLQENGLLDVFEAGEQAQEAELRRTGEHHINR